MKIKFIKHSVFFSVLAWSGIANATDPITVVASAQAASAVKVDAAVAKDAQAASAVKLDAAVAGRMSAPTAVADTAQPNVTPVGAGNPEPSTAASAVNIEAAEEIKTSTQDPFISINRKIYKFNKTLDALYLKPVSMTYSKVIPKHIKSSVGNFFSNVGEVPNTINHILQGQLKRATQNVMRLILNSTFGIGGIFDMATPLGFPPKRTDFGQTMMHLGYQQSRYVVLPIFGPSTVRDGVGLAANSFISVPTYLKSKWRNRYLATQFLHNRAELQDVVDIVKTAGVDEYVLVRDGYLQRRQYLSNETTSNADATSAGTADASAAAPAVAPVLAGPPD